MTTYGELFAGVGGMSLGFDAAGFDVRWHAEWDRYCQQVLRYRYPDVPLYGDVSHVRGDVLEPVDVIAFGSPCQDLSIAGQRKGFTDGHRSVLFLEATRIIKEMRDATGATFPRWAVWENVGGALDSHGGADFATALEALADVGALVIEWCQLDAQFFGVPQRRRRVFVVACFDPATAGRCPDPLLPVGEGRPRGAGAGGAAKASSRRATEVSADGSRVFVAGSERGVANPITARNQKGVPSWLDDPGVVVTTYAGGKPAEVANALTRRQDSRMPSRLDMSNVAVYTKRKRARSADDDETGRAAPTLNAFDVGEVCATTLIAFHMTQDPINGPVSPCLPGRGGYMGISDGHWVRRFTPIECERLMGWPDDWTAHGIEDGKPKVISDSQRGKMVGNGVASPVAAFLARQIMEAS